MANTVSGANCTTTTTPTPVPTPCDPLKADSLDIQNGVLTAESCAGVAITKPLNVINPFNSNNEDINAVLLDLFNKPDIHVSALNYNPATGVLTITKNDASVHTTTIPPQVVTTFTNNGDGTYTYINEAGIPTTITNHVNVTSGNPFITVNNTGTANQPVFEVSANLPTPAHVVNTDGSITVQNTGTAQEPVYNISTTHTVDINVANLTYNPTTHSIVLTETDGTVHSIDVSDLVDPQTITTLTGSINGSITYTNEAGTVVTTPPTCDVLGAYVDAGLYSNTFKVVAVNPLNNNCSRVTLPNPTVVVAGDDCVTITSSGTAALPQYTVSTNICNMIKDLPQSGTHTQNHKSVSYNLVTEQCSLSDIPNNVVLTSTDGSITVSNTGNATNPSYDLAGTPETVTTIVDQPNGSQIYTNEAGTQYTIPATLEVTAADDGVIITNTGTVVNPSYSIATDVCAMLEDLPLSGTHTNAFKAVAYNTLTGNCSLTDIPNNAVITSTDGTVTVTNTGTAMNPSWNLATNHTVDINVDNFSYNAATKDIVLTETDGTVHTINVSDLVDNETVTTLVDNMNGSITYTNENGVVTTTQTTCQILQNLTPGGTHSPAFETVAINRTTGNCVTTMQPTPLDVTSTNSSITVTDTGTAANPAVALTFNPTPVCDELQALPTAGTHVAPFEMVTVNRTTGNCATTTMPAPATVAAGSDIVSVVQSGPATSPTYTVDVDICNAIDNLPQSGTHTNAFKAVAYNLSTGNCSLSDIPNNTVLTSTDGSVTITNTGTQMNPSFNLAVPAATVDINVDNFTYNAATKDIVLTETDGTVHNIDLSDLVDTDVTTTITTNANGTQTYTNEVGTTAILPAPTAVTSTGGTLTVTNTGSATLPQYNVEVDICTLFNGLTNVGLATTNHTFVTRNVNTGVCERVTIPATPTLTSTGGTITVTSTGTAAAPTFNVEYDICPTITALTDVGAVTVDHRVLAQNTVTGNCERVQINDTTWVPSIFNQTTSEQTYTEMLNGVATGNTVVNCQQGRLLHCDDTVIPCDEHINTFETSFGIRAVLDNAVGTAFAIPAGVITEIPLGTGDALGLNYGIGAGAIQNGQIVVPCDGQYLVSAQVNLQLDNAGTGTPPGQHGAYLFVNGFFVAAGAPANASVAAVPGIANNSTAYHCIIPATPMRIFAGGILSLRAFSEFVPAQVDRNNLSAHLSVTKIV